MIIVNGRKFGTQGFANCHESEVISRY